MHETDAIILAVFDDEAQPGAVPVPASPRPPDRPRPDGSRFPTTDPVQLVVFDSEPTPEPSQPPEEDRRRQALDFDIGLVDGQTAAFLVVFPVGTPLAALKPRTVLLPAAHNGAPVTSVTLHARGPADPHPVPFLTLPCPRDFKGRLLTLRFADPANPRSLVVSGENVP
jgi:hypothetical protein